MSDERYFLVSLKKSGIGRPECQKRTLVALGLSRFGKTVRHRDNTSVRGMIQKVVHLVDVTVDGVK
ncbi:MAG: 50S ribosomal protein L30 [Myxococcota bacterium]|nr:50S ribosomal protein L30 [Myxococcota bacterium]